MLISVVLRRRELFHYSYDLVVVVLICPDYRLRTLHRIWMQLEYIGKRNTMKDDGFEFDQFTGEGELVFTSSYALWGYYR